MFSFCFGVLIIAVGLLGSLLIDPFWGIAAYISFVHITPQQLHITSFHAPFVIMVIVLVTYVISPKYPNKFTFRPLEFWLQVIMTIGLFIGAIIAFDSEAAMNGAITFAKYTLFFLLFVNIIDSNEKLGWCYVAFYLSSAWMVYKCWDLRGTMPGRFEYINGGIVSDANQFAAALVLLLPLVIIKILGKERWWIRLGASLGGFGMVMAIVITSSRAGFLGLISAIIVFILSLRKYRKKAIVIAALLVIFSIPYINSHYIYRVKSVFSHERIDKDASAKNRIAQWHLAIRLWKNHPFLGVGSKNFGYYMGYFKEGKEWGERGHVCHSLWFETLAEGGVTVFAPLIIMLFLFFKRTIRIKKNQVNEEIRMTITALQAGMVGFLVAASFISRFFYEPIYWWCGFAAIYERILPAMIHQRSVTRTNTDGTYNTHDAETAVF